LKDLQEIRSPEDIKGFSAEELKGLAEQIRQTIIRGVSEGGGHLASSLGVVELTIALHRVFDTPEDKIIWDVGHQSYPHKLLTGRVKDFPGLRKSGGISGFPRRSESAYDAFGTGHSSTSISAALGMLEARDLKGKHYKVVAVIGDGAMTAGLAFEGLNHAGQLRKDLVVVLNDNEMSISRNVGALSSYLNRILTGDIYKRVKKDTRGLLESIPRLGGPMTRFAEKFEESVKNLFLPGMLFEELGFNYVGPIDGHNLEALLETLEKAKELDRPALVHVITTKGKGYEFSEEDPCTYHGVGPFDLETGSPVCKSPGECLAFCDVFGRELTRLAADNPDVVAITAAMREGTGLVPFADAYPERFYDVGIAEPHAVTFAAGLAAEGIRPVVAIYSTFLQRSYDEIIHDVCLQNLPVVFAIDRAGLVGDDGPTHHGVFDLSYLRHVPNLVVMAPKDAPELREMLSFALGQDAPVAIRYPRGLAQEGAFTTPISMGEAELLREGADLAILTVGNMAEPARSAAEGLAEQGIEAAVVNMRFVKPLDRELVRRLARSHGRILTVEENAVQGGFGSSVAEFLHAEEFHHVEVSILGIPDTFIEHGSQSELKKMLGLDREGIMAAAAALLKKTYRT
jgi:1-deoxy-D-xylulose-5-phosphate synthase